jgi:hypothetical protein
MAMVQRLRGAELRLEDDPVAATADLIAARERAGEAALAAALDGGSGRSAGDTAALTEHIGNLVTAIGRAREQRVAAIPLVWKAEATALRQQAADKHEERTTELLAALKGHEGADYAPVSGLSDAPVLSISGGLSGPLTLAITRSGWVRREAAALDQQATQTDRREVVMNGAVNASTRDDLLAAVRGFDVFKLGPTLHETIAWLDGQDAPGRAEATYRLVWRDGTISPAESRVEASVEPRRTSGTAGPAGPAYTVIDGSLPKPRVETFVVGRSAPPPIAAPGIRVVG